MQHGLILSTLTRFPSKTNNQKALVETTSVKKGKYL
jgi:hypothetical protein